MIKQFPLLTQYGIYPSPFETLTLFNLLGLDVSVFVVKFY